MKTLRLFLAVFISASGTGNFLFAQCNPPTAQTDLDIANVRARIMNGADMWWDAVNQTGPNYEVPFGSGERSWFTVALWIGGLDASNNLHFAAQTYRQDGIDFWPGPLDSLGCGISPAVSSQFNHLWKINRQDVINFIGGAPATPNMISYPGNAPDGSRLAPFHDANGDGIYNTADGDYPDFGLNGTSNCCDVLHGDQAIWWVINDNCSNTPHTETHGTPLGIEIQCQAFAFNTTDADINNTTFYQYKIKNCSPNIYHSTYFGFFADPDLGNYLDDFVGCDVGRSMGYCYNDTAYPTGYYQHPPIVGIDFLHSPISSTGLSMSNFSFFNNDFTCTGNPTTAQIAYNYLQTKDCNNNHYMHLGVPANCMYPYNSDPTGISTGGVPQSPWTEITEGNIGFDRRFVMSAGPFTMQPGEVINCITLAAVWARDTTDPGPYYSLAALQTADDKIQLFFDSCYHYGTLGIPPMQNIRASVYPNPASDVLEVNFGSTLTDGTFTLCDIVGKTIRQVSVKNKNRISISCKDIASGIYVYRILNAEGKTGSGKVMIK